MQSPHPRLSGGWAPPPQGTNVTVRLRGENLENGSVHAGDARRRFRHGGPHAGRHSNSTLFRQCLWGIISRGDVRSAPPVRGRGGGLWRSHLSAKLLQAAGTLCGAEAIDAGGGCDSTLQEQGSREAARGGLSAHPRRERHVAKSREIGPPVKQREKHFNEASNGLPILCY